MKSTFFLWLFAEIKCKAEKRRTHESVARLLNLWWLSFIQSIDDHRNSSCVVFFMINNRLFFSIVSKINYYLNEFIDSRSLLWIYHSCRLFPICTYTLKGRKNLTLSLFFISVSASYVPGPIPDSTRSRHAPLYGRLVSEEHLPAAHRDVHQVS